MAKLDQRRGRHDAFYRRAKQDSYAARSIYKLEEIDRRFRILRPRQRVLDLGCRPGSWLQYAVERIGAGGFLVGLDRAPLDIALPANVRIIVGDVHEIGAAELRGEHPCFHVVLSDMAPDTTGVASCDKARSVALCERALELARAVSCPGGAFVGKVFMGEGFAELLEQAKRGYQQAKTVRPQATRKSSSEVYLVATARR